MKSIYVYFYNFSGQPVLFWMSSYMSLWSNILFNCAVLINLIVAFFYPFVDSVPSKFLYISFFSSQICTKRTYLNIYFLAYCRIEFTLICSYLGGDAFVSSYCHYLTSRIRYTNASRFNDITIDFFYRTRTNIMVTWLSYGKFKATYIK